jgi:hypothetical protein
MSFLLISGITREFAPSREFNRRPTSPTQPPLPRERFSRVPGMFGSLEVKVLYPPDGGEGLAMRKGYRREAGSEGSAEQMCELMDKNRI